MNDFSEYDVVCLKRDMPEARLSAGAVGAVLIVHGGFPTAYEVEFCDADGTTIALLTLTANELEKKR